MKLLATLCLFLFASVSLADDYIVIVFDTSGSMKDRMPRVGRQRMEVAQEALIDSLSKVPPTTKVGVLTFVDWIYDIDTVKPEILNKAIKDCEPHGGTPLYKTMKTGVNRLLQMRAKNLNVGTYKLLVVTDGDANPDDKVLNQDSTWEDGTPKPGILKETIARGIIVDAIGLDMKESHDLKKLINGSYMHGDDPNSIKEGVHKAIAEVSVKDGTGEDQFFGELNSMPDLFVKATIKGLTEFQNHPLGTRVVVMPNAEVVLLEGPTSSKTWLYVMILSVIAVILVVFCVVSQRKN